MKQKGNKDGYVFGATSIELCKFSKRLEQMMNENYHTNVFNRSDVISVASLSFIGRMIKQ